MGLTDRELTDRDLNRATLERQLLLRRERLDPAEAVRRLGGLQSQEPASPYLALWTRLAKFDPATLDAAFADRTVVKASLMRLTLHTVHAADWPAFHAAMLASLRASRLNDRRFLGTGLTAEDADAQLPHLARFLARPHTSGEIEQRLAERLGVTEPRAWWALKMYAPLHHAPTGGPWAFGAESSFQAAKGELDPKRHTEAVHALLRSYLRAYGPATAQDFAQFTMLRQPLVRQALTELDGEVVPVKGPNRAALFDLAELQASGLPDAETPAPPRLLPMWDGTLLGYADRSRIVPAEYRSLVIQRNGDVLPTLLVDGYVAGVWRPAEAGAGIEATAFRALDEDTWTGLAAEAVALRRFLDKRDPGLYRRYAHWWTKGMPRAEVRILAG